MMTTSSKVSIIEKYLTDDSGNRQCEPLDATRLVLVFSDDTKIVINGGNVLKLYRDNDKLSKRLKMMRKREVKNNRMSNNNKNKNKNNKRRRR